MKGLYEYYPLKKHLVLKKCWNGISPSPFIIKIFKSGMEVCKIKALASVVMNSVFESKCIKYDLRNGYIFRSRRINTAPFHLVVIA